jgi:hypothetical protein
VSAAQPERFLEDARGTSQEAVHLLQIVEAVPAENALALVTFARALNRGQRIRVEPSLAHSVIERCGEGVPIRVARLRGGRRHEHPGLRRSTLDDPAFLLQRHRRCS